MKVAMDRMLAAELELLEKKVVALERRIVKLEAYIAARGRGIPRTARQEREVEEAHKWNRNL